MELQKIQEREHVVTAKVLATLHSLAVRGYNAEIRYKSARSKKERPSERAMRRMDELAAIESVRADVEAYWASLLEETASMQARIDARGNVEELGGADASAFSPIREEP